MIAGECLLIVEEQERTLEAWDYFHCPGGTDHIIVGAGEGPAIVVAVGRARPWDRWRHRLPGLRARGTPRRERRARDDRAPARRTPRSSPSCRGRGSSRTSPDRCRRRLTRSPAGYCFAMASPSAVLSQGQLALLAEHGEERRAEVGDILFKVGDRTLSADRDHRGRGGDPRRRGRRDHPPRRRPASSARRTCSRARPST